MSEITFTINLEDFPLDIKEPKTDEKGNVTQWGNVNVFPFVEMFLQEIAKASGYDAGEGFRWSCPYGRKPGQSIMSCGILVSSKEAKALPNDDNVMLAKKWAESIAKGQGSLEDLKDHKAFQKMVATLLKRSSAPPPPPAAIPPAPIPAPKMKGSHSVAKPGKAAPEGTKVFRKNRAA
jgi:hypothetical protein